MNDRTMNEPERRPDQMPKTAQAAGQATGLEARNIGKRYRKRPVLRGINLTVRRGEVVGLLGPNGAGKTTCFYTIVGLVAPDQGQILLDGQDITTTPMYRRSQLGIGYLPQEASIFRGLTVEGNIMAVLEAVEKDRETREIMLDDLLNEFSVSHLRRTPALALSGGERRRVEIARALAADPRFILLDEPFAGVNPVMEKKLLEQIDMWVKEGKTVLLTDHEMAIMMELCESIYVFDYGSVIAHGTPQEVRENPRVMEAYFGS